MQQRQPTAATPQPSSSSTGASAAPMRFPEEHGIVLDKWIFDVCGEDGMQFPSHRRQQYPAYMEHCRWVNKQKSFVAGTFAYPSRSGTREVLVLQTMLEALGAKEQAALRAASKVDANIAQFKKVLSEKTMGASDLNPSTAKAGRTTTTAGTGPQNGHPESGQKDGGDSSDAAALRMGYAPLTSSNGNGSAGATPGDANFSEDAREARRAQYEQKRSIAERYTRELARKTAEMRARREEMDARHRQLQEEKLQLDKEYSALEMTENIVVGRHEETAAQLAAEQAALTEERAAWAALSGDPVTTTTEEATANHDDEPDATPAPPTQPAAFNLNDSVLHLNQTLTSAEPSLQPADVERQQTLEKLRAQLSDAGAAYQELKRQLLNGEQVHTGRFRQAKQKLRDWQDLAAAARRTHTQLKGQVHVLSTVVQDTAERLAANAAAADRASYLDQVYRFNALLAERSSEKLREFMGEPAVSSPTELQFTDTHGVSAFTAEVRPLARPAPSASPTPMKPGSGGSHTDPNTPMNRSATSDSTPTRGDGVPRALRHRSRYDLVRHLQRWELALQSERAQILEAAGMQVSDRTTGENVVKPVPDGSLEARTAHLRQRFLQLQKMLLQGR